MIKSERLIPITPSDGSPGFVMMSMGLQYARDGIDDPLVLPPGYDQPIPEANIEYSTLLGCAVWAFPQAVPAPPVPPTGRRHSFAQYTKPPWSG